MRSEEERAEFYGGGVCLQKEVTHLHEMTLSLVFAHQEDLRKERTLPASGRTSTK